MGYYVQLMGTKIRRLWHCVFAVLILLTLTSWRVRQPRAIQTLGASAENVEFVGQLGGLVTAIAVQGDHAYIADDDDGLRVVDVSDPGRSIEVGFYDTARRAKAVAVAAGYAYVADEYGGLRVVDVFIPCEPSPVGLLDTPGPAKGVEVQGHFAFVAAGGAGLLAVDISTPSNPGDLGL